MNSNNTKTIHITAYLLLALVATQAVFTALYIAEISGPRKIIWGLEGALFTLLAAFAGAAMVESKTHQLAWSAIAFSAVLNLIQVSIGLTMFGPFGEVAKQVEGVGPAAGAVVAFSFMVYYAAKLLLGLAALVLGRSIMNDDSKVLGGLAAFFGAIALLANAALIIFGRDAFLPSPVAGASGVLATLLIAICLIKTSKES